MEKHVKTELHLSEEHLQAITGGCAQCVADLEKAAVHQHYANFYNNKTTQAEMMKIGSSTPEEAQKYTRLQDTYDGLTALHAKAADVLIDRVAARGHG